jgi:hypothetical protein
VTRRKKMPAGRNSQPAKARHSAVGVHSRAAVARGGRRPAVRVHDGAAVARGRDRSSKEERQQKWKKELDTKHDGVLSGAHPAGLEESEGAPYLKGAERGVEMADQESSPGPGSTRSRSVDGTSAHTHPLGAPASSPAPSRKMGRRPGLGARLSGFYTHRVAISNPRLVAGCRGRESPGGAGGLASPADAAHRPRPDGVSGLRARPPPEGRGAPGRGLRPSKEVTAVRLPLISPTSVRRFASERGMKKCALSRICGTMVETKPLPEGLYAGHKLTEEAF